MMSNKGHVQGEKAKKSQESQKQVHYDYKNLLGSMMRKFSWMLLALLVLAGCGEEITQVEEKPKMVEMELPPPSKITWEKDGSQMVLVLADSLWDGGFKE